MACSVTVTIQSRRRTCSNSWQTMASWMSAGNSAKWPGNTTTGRNSPNVTGPDSADDSLNSACGATAARRRSRLGGRGANTRASRRQRRSLPNPTASHSARAAQPEASTKSRAWRQGRKYAGGRFGETGVAAPMVNSMFESAARRHGSTAGSNRQIANNVCQYASRIRGTRSWKAHAATLPAAIRATACALQAARLPSQWAALTPPSDQPPDLLDLVRRQVAVFDQMHQQGLRRTVEHAIDEIPHHGADHPALRLGRAVDVGALHLLPVEVALVFQDLHHRHDGGVGDPAPLQQGLINVPDRGGVPLPDDLHDLQFLVCEGLARGPHTKELVLLNENVKGFLGARRAPWRRRASAARLGQALACRGPAVPPAYQIISFSNSGRGRAITTLFTSSPFCAIAWAPAATALSTAATSPVRVTNALPPRAMASRTSINCTSAAFAAASAPSISEATENDSTMPSASSRSTFTVPLMAGKMDSCRLAIMKQSMTEKLPAVFPAATAAWTAPAP